MTARYGALPWWTTRRSNGRRRRCVRVLGGSRLPPWFRSGPYLARRSLRRCNALASRRGPTRRRACSQRRVCVRSLRSGPLARNRGAVAALAPADRRSRCVEYAPSASRAPAVRPDVAAARHDRRARSRRTSAPARGTSTIARPTDDARDLRRRTAWLLQLARS